MVNMAFKKNYLQQPATNLMSGHTIWFHAKQLENLDECLGISVSTKFSMKHTVQKHTFMGLSFLLFMCGNNNK